MRDALAITVTVCLILNGGVSAHPGHAHAPQLRTWNDAEGLKAFDASFVHVKDDRVQLCQEDGSIVWVPIAELSEADREWLRNRLESIRRVNSFDVAVQDASTIESPHSTSPKSALPLILSMFGLAAFTATGNFLRRRPIMIPILAAIVLPCSLGLIAAAKDDKQASPAIQTHFEPFKDKLKYRSDDDYFTVESNGLPDHPMMVGIKSWQQQVPLPQPYTGKNAWQIPLHPKLAEKPISGKKALYRGAIALAVNGVPIFNALNNRGVDAYLAGELDEFGGHCGRADDYHYHMAPVHLVEKAGKGNPIAFALDGYPLYGYTDAEGKEPNDLDEYNGRMEKDGYRYYSTKKYPYINGGLRGAVTVRNDGVEPQPRAAPLRPAGQPLRGAKITDFSHDKEANSYTLKYELGGKTLSWKYTPQKDGSVRFVFADVDGKESTETYRPREGKDGPPPKKDGPAPKKAMPPASGT